jgi:hypothetical protein
MIPPPPPRTTPPPPLTMTMTMMTTMTMTMRKRRRWVVNQIFLYLFGSSLFFNYTVNLTIHFTINRTPRPANSTVGDWIYLD